MDESQILRTLKSIVFWLTAVAVTISVIQSMVEDIPTWLNVVFAIVIALLGLLGVSRVTPVNDPRDNEGRRLVPEQQ